MFTGIVEGVGLVRQSGHQEDRSRLEIRPLFPLKDLKIGESISVDGCCLTVTGKKNGGFSADLSPETLRVTRLGTLSRGDPVNLERPVRLTDRLGGHLVAGHVDGVGRIQKVSRAGGGRLIQIRFPRVLRRYLVPKGSIAVNGVSMTINRLGTNRFSLFVVPETLRKTNLSQLKPDDRVNLEVDMIGKYIERLWPFRGKR